MKRTRRDFLTQTALATTGILVGGSALAATKPNFDFDISLAQWCFNYDLFAGKMNHLDFAKRAKTEFDISAIEYVNQFFKDKAKDKNYLNEMKKRAADQGVKSVLIMIDGEGDMANPDQKALNASIENHYKWIEAAEFLGCHAIRVNAHGNGDYEASKKAAIQGMSKLCDFAKDHNINVIIEPHGGFSSHGGWLSEVMAEVDMKNCGTLPDFGNFCLKRGPKYECLEAYDVYKGTKEIMPYAKGVSAKTFDFDNQGNEVNYDYKKLFTIIKNSGFKGYVGIEYEGNNLSPEEGIKKTKALLERMKKEV